MESQHFVKRNWNGKQLLQPCKKHEKDGIPLKESKFEMKLLYPKKITYSELKHVFQNATASSKPWQRSEMIYFQSLYPNITVLDGQSKMTKVQKDTFSFIKLFHKS